MATAAASAPLPTKEAPPSNPPTQNVGGAKKAKAKKKVGIKRWKSTERILKGTMKMVMVRTCYPKV